MSSDLKDARWGMAMWLAYTDELDWYDLTYEHKEMYLSAAQVELTENPEDIPGWANEFRSRD